MDDRAKIAERLRLLADQLESGEVDVNTLNINSSIVPPHPRALERTWRTRVVVFIDAERVIPGEDGS